MPSPRRVRWAKIRSFAVGLAALAIVATLVYLLTGGTLFEQKVTIYLHVPDGTGIGPQSDVRVDGIGVGKVQEASLTPSSDPNRVVLIVIRMERAVLPGIPADSWAQLSSDTLIGDKFVDISSGRSPEHLQPGAELIYREQTDLMKSLDLQQFEKSLRDVDATLTDIEQGRSRVGQFVLGDAMYNDIRTNIVRFDESLRAAVGATSAVGHAIYGVDTYEKIRAPILEFDRALARIQSGQGPAGQLLRDSAMYDQLTAIAQDLQHTVRDLHASEFIRSDTAYQDWNRLTMSLIQRVDEFNAGSWFSASSAPYDNLAGGVKELGKSMKEFREDPRKFLRLKLF